MTDLAPLCRRLHALFSETADAVARQTGFVQRDSKLSGPHSAITLVTPACTPQWQESRLGFRAVIGFFLRASPVFLPLITARGSHRCCGRA